MLNSLRIAKGIHSYWWVLPFFVPQYLDIIDPATPSFCIFGSARFRCWFTLLTMHVTYNCDCPLVVLFIVYISLLSFWWNWVYLQMELCWIYSAQRYRIFFSEFFQKERVRRGKVCMQKSKFIPALLRWSMSVSEESKIMRMSVNIFYQKSIQNGE